MRFAPAAALGLVAVAAWRSGLLSHLSLAELGRRETELRSLVQETPLEAAALYVAAFAVLTAACLPVALLMTLAAGLLFGPWLGGSVVILGATLAALAAYGAARSALADWIRRRARRDPRLQRVLSAFGDNAFFSVLALRLMPICPFYLVNLASGVAAVPVRAYAPATMIGAIPSSFIYASLGAGLGAAVAHGRVSLADLAGRPQVIWPLAGLALLSLAPLAARWWLARRRDRAGQTRPPP